MNVLLKFNKLLKFLNYHNYYCGCEVLSDNFRYSNRTFFSIISVFVYYFCTTYLFIFLPSFIPIAMAQFGMATQGSVKLYMALTYRSEFSAMFNEFHNMYVTILPEGSKSRRYQILNACVDTCILFYKAYTMLYVAAAFVCLLYPIVMYWLYQDLFYTFVIFFPFIEHTSTAGYSLNSCYHLICLLLVINGSLEADGVFMVAVAHFDMQVNTFFVQLDEFDEFLGMNEYTEHGSEWRNRVQTLVDTIIRTHRDIIDKKNRLNYVFFNSIAVQIGTSIVSLAVALFLAVTTNWYISWACIFCSVFQMLLYCGLGTVIEWKSDRIVVAIYGTKWYLIPVNEQKKICLVLKRSQKSMVVYIAGLFKLNMETCVEILKKIYSFFMLLMESKN